MSSPSQPIRKRRGPAYSCTECRRCKVQCDRTKPCGQCIAHNLVSFCTYEDRRSLPASGLHNATHSEEQEERTHSTLEQPLPSDTSPHPSTTGRIQGTVSKTRVFGNGHWMNIFSLVGFYLCLDNTCLWFPSDKAKVDGLSVLHPFVEYYDMVFGESNEGPQDQNTQIVDQCKCLARDVKKQRPSRRCLPADMYRSLPRREVADELIQLYFTTFEPCFRILHLLSFKAQYESCVDRQEVAETSFLLQVYLILSLAGTLHDDPTVRREMTTKTRTWVHIAETWLSAPLEKDRLTLKGIQVHCLLLLAHQVNQVGADLVWISAGSLMRMAMQMGLHQDPDYLGEIGVRQKEVRRRLWYTILEMNVQAALDSGMPPMIMDGDYNTVSPSSVSDHELEGKYKGNKEVSQTILRLHFSLCYQVPSLSDCVPPEL